MSINLYNDNSNLPIPGNFSLFLSFYSRKLNINSKNIPNTVLKTILDYSQVIFNYRESQFEKIESNKDSIKKHPILKKFSEVYSLNGSLFLKKTKKSDLFFGLLFSELLGNEAVPQTLPVESKTEIYPLVKVNPSYKEGYSLQKNDKDFKKYSSECSSDEEKKKMAKILVTSFILGDPDVHWSDYGGNIGVIEHEGKFTHFRIDFGLAGDFGVHHKFTKKKWFKRLRNYANEGRAQLDFEDKDLKQACKTVAKILETKKEAIKTIGKFCDNQPYAFPNDRDCVERFNPNRRYESPMFPPTNVCRGEKWTKGNSFSYAVRTRVAQFCSLVKQLD